MGYVGNVKIGSDTHLVGSTLYGTCDTAKGTAAKVVTCANFTTLITGVTIHVKFTNSNTVANPTLNVNSTGAKNIYRYGTTAPSTSAATSWQAGAVVSFTYDGTSWIMNDWLNDNTTYTAASATPNAVSSAGAVGTSSKYAREDHTHAISVGTGDSNGQVKVAGQNASVKGLGSAAYTASTAYATSGHNHDNTYLKLSGGTMTGGLGLSSALTDSRFASTNQQILNVDGGDNTTRTLYVGNPTNCSEVAFETKNGTVTTANIRDTINWTSDVNTILSNEGLLGELCRQINDSFTFGNLIGETRPVFFSNWTDNTNFPSIYGSGLYFPCTDNRCSVLIYGGSLVGKIWYRLISLGSSFDSNWVEVASQANFQAGVDSIYNAVVAKGSTPASKSLSDVVNGIANIPNYNDGNISMTQRTTWIDLGVNNKYRWIHTNEVPNSNSGTYSISSNGTHDMGETNSYRYVSVNVPQVNLQYKSKTITLSSSNKQPWTDDWYYGSTSVTFDFPNAVLGIASIGGINFYSNGYAGPTGLSGNTVNIGFTIHATSVSVTINAYGY